MNTRRLLSFANLAFQQWKLNRWANAQSVASRRIVRKALELASIAHQNQWRDDGGPYIIHPVRTANILLYELKLNDIALVAAALLHDVLEDSTISSVRDIRRRFGARIARLVNNNTRPRSRDETEADKLKTKPKKLRETMKADRETRLVKCADILDNMRSWGLLSRNHPSRSKFHRWANEATRFYIPMAEKTHPYLAFEMRKAFAAFRRR